MDRRKFLMLSALGAGMLMLSPTLLGTSYGAVPEKALEVIKEKVGVPLEQIKESPEVTLKAPTIAETPTAIPIEVESTIPVEKVEKLWIIVDGNPNPWIADLTFTPQSGRVWFATRIKMAQSSNVRAILKLKDGSYVMAVKEVKVTAGGCG
ncbi:thiosulfate oxidation carrier protein SoxY [Thermocrinis minervae]|uniref:Thiosulfate-binding protein SoxY n=1 Tax=Thermocrinis minervae TaxID=381751 RepID=A0A1M6T7L2_9AQUI|nr:thiosulfate oxidation carrier protein SoxY [Thermocrinis minervae]SHK52981.1 thiosulfate-binding protein SoxY [Thermocrinis minervae]